MSEIEFTVRNLVSTKAGTLPILLTCPHDGTEHPIGVDERQRSNLRPDCPVSQFNKDPDLFTSDITIGVAERIFALTNEWPYVVVFNSHRKYIDANREKKCGCEVSEAELYYDEYHSRIAQFAQEIRTNRICSNRLVFLFDFHGKDDNASDISVGTRNKGTIQQLVEFNPGWGWDYKYGLNSLLIKKGYTISPGSPCEEDDPKFFGGYTVKEHGGWQFEIANSKRKPRSKRETLVNDLAESIRIFYEHNCIEQSE